MMQLVLFDINTHTQNRSFHSSSALFKAYLTSSSPYSSFRYQPLFLHMNTAIQFHLSSSTYIFNICTSVIAVQCSLLQSRFNYSTNNYSTPSSFVNLFPICFAMYSTSFIHYCCHFTSLVVAVPAHSAFGISSSVQAFICSCIQKYPSQHSFSLLEAELCNFAIQMKSRTKSRLFHFKHLTCPDRH